MTKPAPHPRAGILDIAPYVPGESSLSSGVKPIKLSSNETPFGPSPLAIQAYADCAKMGLHRYPDGGAMALRAAIGKRFGLDAERIVCGAGSDELLNLIAQAYLEPGTEAIYTEHGFLVYPIVIRANGAVPIVAPESDCRAQVDAILALVTEKTRIVFLANPNNPTGTYVPAEDVRRLRAGLPDNVLLVLDAAYAEYVKRNDYEAGIELVATTENTVMTRTFSKVYGLASLRLGWAYCPASVTDVLNRIRGPFNVSLPAMYAGIAAIGDLDHLGRSVEHNEKWLAWLTGQIELLGLKVTPSVANFILVHFPDVPKRGAVEADAFLKSRGIIVRRVSGYGLPNALRITIGTESENVAVVEALVAFQTKVA